MAPSPRQQASLQGAVSCLLLRAPGQGDPGGASGCRPCDSSLSPPSTEPGTGRAQPVRSSLRSCQAGLHPGLHPGGLQAETAELTFRNILSSMRRAGRANARHSWRGVECLALPVPDR